MPQFQLKYEIIKLFDVIEDPITGERKINLDKNYAYIIQDNFDQITKYANVARETQKQTITLLPNNAVLPTSNPPALAQINTATHSYKALDYDATTAESAFWHLTMPENYNNQDITVQVKYIANTTSGAVVWVAGIRGIAENENVNFSNGEEDRIFSADTVNAVANYLNIAELSITSTWFDAGEWLCIPIRRFASTDSDTLTVDARLLEVVIKWEI